MVHRMPARALYAAIAAPAFPDESSTTFLTPSALRCVSNTDAPRSL